MTTYSGTRATRLRAIVRAQLPLPCTKCGAQVPADSDDWDVDHLHARADGGAVWDVRNVGPAHSSCNRAAGARDGNARRSGTGRRLRPW